ncbi:DGQHR domain-containing protein [Mucilaginibacter sp.]|uniref:DGQHR domain-containing protein n=1 Tax=Mucilaginibacter sp. TaxID=1882438 RepID=UPI00261DC20B|nr:DGQHR domain-containing protein [Mucilaginibacter sp.]
MQEITFKCLKCKQPIGEFYIGVMNYDDLIKISYADIRRLETGTEMREVEVYTGIQRELAPNRVKEIAKYVNMVDSTFPTGVILHIEEKDIIYSEENSTMTLPFKDTVAKVLDGQHRIAGLEFFPERGSEFQVNVTIFIGMELEDQAIVFATINKTQTKVNKSLVSDLYDFATNRSPQKTAHNIVRALNQKEGSPFYEKIKILGVANDKEKETITQATFAEGIIKYISRDAMADRDIYKRGKTPNKFTDLELLSRPLRNIFIDEQDHIIAQILWNYFDAVMNKWPNAWNLVTPEMILNKSTGFLALMKFFKDAYISFGKIGQVVTIEEFSSIFNRINLLDKDFNRGNYLPGTAGQAKLYNELMLESGLN